MDCDLVFANYRCFGRDKPVTLKLRSGLQAFVGLNNAGKTALVRSLYELRSLFQYMASEQAFGGHLGGYRAFHAKGPSGPLMSANLINNRRPDWASIKIQLHDVSGPNTPDRMYIYIREDGAAQLAHPEFGPTPVGISYDPGIPTQLALNANGKTELFGHLDWISLFRSLADTFYLPSIRAATTGGQFGQDWYDIQLGASFVSRLRAMEINKDRASANQFFAIQEELARLLDFRTLEIKPVHEHNEIAIRVNGKLLALDDVGAGVSQFIVAAISVFLRKPSYLLVEEPELNLHPALQERYLTLLASCATRGVLFTTHSLGLARSVTDRIWMLKREGLDGDSVVLPFEDPEYPTEMLAALQYGSMHSVGMRLVLLVEGPNDVMTIRQWLRKLGKDIEVLVLPLCGASLISAKAKTTLDDLKRFGVPVAAVIDSEISGAGQPLSSERRAFADICGSFDIKCVVTKKRALENYLTQRAIDLAFPGRHFAALDEFAHSSTVGWGKAQSWRVAMEMTPDEVVNSDVGEFLRTL